MSEKVPELKIVWSRDEGESFSYDSLAELLETYDELEPGMTVLFGEAVSPDPASYVDADDVIENIACRGYDDGGRATPMDEITLPKEATGWLCYAHGESTWPVVEIARTRDEVSAFIVEHWLGDKDDADLPGIMAEFDAHDWHDLPIEWKFEIGGLRIEAVWQADRAARPSAVPDGWKLVPIRLTEEMHAAAVLTIVHCTGNDDWPPRVYAAMLAAAPQPPAPDHSEGTLAMVADDSWEKIEQEMRASYWMPERERADRLAALLAAPTAEDEPVAAWMNEGASMAMTAKVKDLLDRSGAKRQRDIAYTIPLYTRPAPKADADASDAARYRWLREKSNATVYSKKLRDKLVDGAGSSDFAYVAWDTQEGLDAAIDAAMAEQGAGS